MFRNQKVGQVLLLEIDSIASNPYQPRRKFEPAGLQELADSIAANGLLQPVTVRKTTAGYELIAGERRLMACRMLHMKKIPALVDRYTEEQTAIFALIENLQRQDLNYFEQAEGLHRLMKQCGFTQEQLARRLGKSQPTIANKLRLLAFPEPLRRLMLEHNLTERHARALLRLPQVAWHEVLLQIIQKKMNVTEAEMWIAQWGQQPQQEAPQAKKPKKLLLLRDFRIFMNTISQAVSTMKLAGIEIDTQQEEDEEYIHYSMRIPKHSAYRSHTA